jgi:gamma-glutamyltranspeptidase/glutathione hydrolase
VDRFFYSGDIDVNSNATYRDLLKKEYADGLFDLISRMGDTKTMEYIRCLHPDEKDLFGERRLPSGNETTHFSIIDSEGNAVSNSYTLNLRYGSKWSVKGAGFLLNGSIDAFSFLVGKPNYFGVMGNPPNLFDANKRPASNMAPVIVTDGSRSEILLGTPGGPTIQTSMAMILFLVLGKKLHPVEAVQASRIHHQAWPDILYKEKSGLSEIIVENLCRKGYDIQDKNEPIGDIHGIFLDGDAYIAVSDYRREGYACAL